MHSQSPTRSSEFTCYPMELLSVMSGAQEPKNFISGANSVSNISKINPLFVCFSFIHRIIEPSLNAELLSLQVILNGTTYCLILTFPLLTLTIMPPLTYFEFSSLLYHAVTKSSPIDCTPTSLLVSCSYVFSYLIAHLFG